MPKVMVVIPEILLEEVDGAARESQTNRSAFICRSLRAQLRSAKLRRLRQRILDDARAIARDFHSYWDPEDEPTWMAAENEALKLRHSRVPDQDAGPDAFHQEDWASSGDTNG